MKTFQVKALISLTREVKKRPNPRSRVKIDSDNATAIVGGRFDEILNRKPPEHLYHYTDQSGLLGIVQSRQFWATKVQYMNDTTEFALAIDMAQELLIEKVEAWPESRI